MKLVQLDIKNTDDYYIGEVKKEIEDFKVIKTIDSDGYLGGIELLKNEAVIENKNSKALKYFMDLNREGKIKDPYSLSQQDAKILSLQFKDIKEFLKQICGEKRIISITISDQSEIVGMLTSVKGNRLFLKQINDAFELVTYESEFIISDLIELSINDSLNNLRTKWIENNQDVESELVSLYPAYTDDDKFGENYVTGKILDEDENHYLILEVDEMGQADTVAIFAKDKIAHVGHKSADLSFCTFGMKIWKKKGIFDPEDLETRAKALIRSLDMRSFIQNVSKNQIITVLDEDGESFFGLIIEAENDSFTIKIIDIDHFIDEYDFDYDELICIDILSKENLKSEKMMF